MYYQKKLSPFARNEVKRYLAIFQPGQRVKVSDFKPKPPPMDYYLVQRWSLNNYSGVVVSSTSKQLLVRKDCGNEVIVMPFMCLSVSRETTTVTSQHS